MPKARKKKNANICGDCKVAPKPAITAAKLGHTQCLTTAYRELGVFNERDDYGATPIHFAARFGKLECLVWLVSRSGVSPNAVSRNGATAAHDAATMGHLECLQYLIKNTRCSIEDATSEGATVLHMACRFGRLDVVKWLMEYSGSSPNEKGANNVTPVHLCAAKNHLGCLKWLTQHPKYVPNEQTVHGATPVYFASQEGSVQCLQWLIEHGSGEPYITATDGMGPIHAASQAGQIKCLEYLVKKANVPIRHRAEDSATPAHFAAASGQVQCLEWILENGGSMDDRDNLGGTPVHDAAEQGQVLTLSTLIRHGADLDTEDYEGLKPVDLARNNNYEDCFKLLFKVVKPNILVSLTPHQSLTRASAEDEEQTRLRAEKQRRFEEAMLGDISEERKEAIWQSAQQRASNLQPGLKLLLEGKAAPSPSTLKVERELGGEGSAIQLSPTGSLRHSRHSTGRRSIKRQMDEDFLPDDLHPYKPRPHLTPYLFQQPNKEDINVPPSTGAKIASAGDKVVLRNKAASNEAKKSQYRQSADSPVPPRAKFLKKFGIKKPPRVPSVKTTEKKLTRKQSIEQKQDPLSKKTSSSAVEQKSPQKSDKIPTGRLVKKKSGSAVQHQKQRPVQKKVSKSKVSSPPEQQAQRKLLKTKQGTKDAQVSKQKVAVSKKSPKLKKAAVQEEEEKREKKTTKDEVVVEVDVHVTEGKSEAASNNPYMFFANNLVEGLIMDSVSSRNSAPLATEREATGTQSGTFAEVDIQTKPTVQHSPDAIKTEPINVEATSPSPSEEVVLRPKKKSKQTFKEEAVISKSNIRKSLKSPDETVTVSFVTKATNIKQSFPITHHALMADDDLSSPGSSDDDEEPPQRESFTVPGFERLDPNTFEMFGDDMSELEMKRKDLEREWEKEENRESFHDDISHKYEQKHKENVQEKAVDRVDEKVKEEYVQRTKIDDTRPAVGEKPKDHDTEPETDSETRLTRWSKEGTLHEADDTTTHETSMVDVNSPPTEGASKPSEKRSIVQTGTTAIYNKFQDFDRLKKERGYTDVMKMVTQLQGKKQETTSDPATSQAPSRLGNVSAKLAMFGGGATYIKPPPMKQTQTTEPSRDSTSKKASTFKSEEESEMVENQFPESPSHTEEDKQADSPNKETASVQQSDLQASAASTEVTTSVLQPRQRMRSTSSLISITTFETIKEEEDESGAEIDDDLERVESTDKITPLPNMPPPLSRRHSEELLRLDGMEVHKPSTTESDKTPPLDRKESPPRSRALDIKEKEVRRSPSPPKRRHSGGSSVYSPLMQSSDASTVQKREKSNRGEKPRPLSVPPSPPKGSEAMALYMNSANLPHLNHLKVKHEKEETSAAEALVEALLSKPKHTQEQVPLEFRGLVLSEGIAKFYTWKQKAGSLQKLDSLDSVHFEQNEIYIFLYVTAQGPLLHHVFIWVGRNVNEFALHSAYQHCENLVNTLPGRPVVHKEFEGYESFFFTHSLESGGKSTSEKQMLSLSYLNPAMEKAKLYTYDSTASSFEFLAMHYQSITKMTVPVIMDTFTRVNVWIPRGGTQLKQNPMEIAEMFIIHNSYPKWTPVSIMTQDGETTHFLNHFPSWPCVDLNLASKSKELHLPFVRQPEVTYPVTGQTKIWCLDKQELRQVQLDQFGHFNSSGVYLVQFVYHKRSALFTWVEGMVYVWVGADVQQKRGDIVKEAYEKCKTIGPNSKMPVVIVSEGKEPTQLLNLFKGKFIIHKTSQESSGLKLYKVSGSSALAMKAVEVPPKSSNLHSCYAYLLLNESGKLYAWSGQFSSKIHRRGALVIAKMLPTESSNSIKLAEGLESPEFWTQLGGKSKYPQSIPAEFPPYSLPVLYSCEAKQGLIIFVQLSATKKEELKSNICYILQYRDQLFIREGGYWKKGFHQLNVIRTFIQQFHSWKNERDFNTTLVTEGNEGEMFWKWFDIQNITSIPGEDNKTIHPNAQRGERSEQANLGQESVDSADLQLTDAVQLRDPPTSQSVSLTKSQEVAFEKVEKLQEQLESLEEAGGSEGHSGASSREGGGQDEAEMSDEVKSKKAQESPFKTSQTVKELGNLIEGLDNLLRSTSQASVVDKPTDHEEMTGPGDGSGTSLQPPPISKLLSQTDIKSEEQSPNKKTKAARHSTAKSPVSMIVTVEIADGRGVFDVTVKEKAPVISVIFKAAKTAGITLKPESALFEVSESLKIHRPLEDHELIKDVMAQWPTKNRPKLVLRDFATKNMLWASRPPIPKQAITAYVKHNKVPEVTSQLLYCKKGGSKLTWKEGSFFLRALGIYNIVDTKKASKIDLCSSLDHHVYTPMAVQGKGYETPNPFCFIMKPPNSWKEKDLKFYCLSDIRTMAQWVHTIRLLKHGLQLKGNFIAMKTRLQKLADETQQTSSA